MDETISRTRHLTSAEALDAAFAGARCELVRADGQAKLFSAHRWTSPASPDEVVLFVDPCTGSTLDVGCGPGRLTVALTNRGVTALGLDVSGEAVRLTRERGGAAVHQDVFDELPTAPRWQHMLLADGNIGLGGDPVRLLRRLLPLLETSGTILVELAGPGVSEAREQVRLRVDGQSTEPFAWATLGTDDIGRTSAVAGLAVHGVRTLRGRHVATLGRRR